MNTWVSFQSAEQPLLGQFSVSGNNVVAKLMVQYPKARPDSVLRVLTRLTMEDKTAPFIQRHDDMQHYRFEDLEIRMNRRSYNAEPAPRRLAPIAFYSHYEPLPTREPADG
ncbi:hypothetical protein ACMGOL_006678 [Pseudomonas aeruginosa]